MACGVFHKASKAVFTKVKNFLGKAGKAIVKGAKGVYNFLSNNKEAIHQGANAAANIFGGKIADGINKGIDYYDKGMGYADKVNGVLKNINIS